MVNTKLRSIRIETKEEIGLTVQGKAEEHYTRITAQSPGVVRPIITWFSGRDSNHNGVKVIESIYLQSALEMLYQEMYAVTSANDQKPNAEKYERID